MAACCSAQGSTSVGKSCVVASVLQPGPKASQLAGCLAEAGSRAGLAGGMCNIAAGWLTCHKWQAVRLEMFMGCSQLRKHAWMPAQHRQSDPACCMLKRGSQVFCMCCISHCPSIGVGVDIQAGFYLSLGYTYMLHLAGRSHML
jgi:hypothetical protein